MTISILGTGTVGQTLAESLAAKVLSVMLGTRNVSTTVAKAGDDRLGLPSFVDWQATNRMVQLGSFAQAAVFGEVIINATPGIGSLNITTARATEQLLPIGLQLWKLLKTNLFNYSIVR